MTLQHSQPGSRDDLLAGLEAVVQYRRKPEREHDLWKTMAAFDLRGLADDYHDKQRTDAEWPWEYRVVDVPESDPRP